MAPARAAKPTFCEHTLTINVQYRRFSAQTNIHTYMLRHERWYQRLYFCGLRWRARYFEARKEARASEVDSLAKAKAVLSGADFSLLQARARSLRGRA